MIARWWEIILMAMLTLLQINLHHSKTASASLLRQLSQREFDIALIQEPWVVRDLVCGLKATDYILLYVKGRGRPRSCILIKRNLSCSMLYNYSDCDMVTVCLETVSRRYWLVSAYLAHDHQTIPCDTLRNMVLDATSKGVGVILGCDANAHHEVWGSSDTNLRGELLFDYLISTSLNICNIGCEPTFIVSNRQEVLDITLASDTISDLVVDWVVSDEHSFSDHRYITFRLKDNLPNPEPFRDIRKTNWSMYSKYMERYLKPVTPDIPSSREDLDLLVDKLTGFYNTALTSSCPLRKPKGKRKPPWWNPELEKLRKDSRSLFNKAKHLRDADSWSHYKVSLKIYKKFLRKSQRDSWKKFCENVEGVSETSRLRKILASNPTVPSYLKRIDGSWTTSGEESLETLVDAHFPGCSVVDNNQVHYTHEPIGNQSNILTKTRLVWAIDSFKPFKSPGPDGIYPVEIQHTVDLSLDWLYVIYKSCLDLNHIPRRWRYVKVVFIPKAGKSSHVSPKDLRPISLSSFLLKILERLIDTYLRQSIDSRLLSPSQHAYSKGKSVETALHSLVSAIERSLNYKEFSMVAFMDIEGAFNNVTPSAIINALDGLGVDKALGALIYQLLTGRIISATLGAASIQRSVKIGTPQGGVLSPLLWNLAVNSLLVNLEKSGSKVVAYADDIAIAVSGKYVSTVRDIMQNLLSILSNWASSCGLNANPSKTELVLFTRKHSLPHIEPPRLMGISLHFSEEARFLGIILDRKLNWNSNILERVKKANIALYSCKKTVGKKWGLKPMVAQWVYTAVVRPILLYGVVVWWTALVKLTKYKMLDKVQRSAEIYISGALRTTPTAALNIILHLFPLDLLAKQIAANTAIRLKSTNQWYTFSGGHSTILENFRSVPENTDYITPRLDFERNYDITVPSRLDWEPGIPPVQGSVYIYTDGSKMEGGVGGGVFSEELGISLSFRLPDHCSVFQAEVVAIQEAMQWLRINAISSTNIVLLSDSQAALKSLECVQTTSRTLLSCHQSLMEIGGQHNLHLCWVPGHRDIPGNCKADELARFGTTEQVSPDKQLLGMPIATCRLSIHDTTITSTNKRWSEGNTSSKARLVWPMLDYKRTKCLLSLDRPAVRTLIGVLTGHCLIGTHANRLGLFSNDFCRSCRDEDEEENMYHLLCSCPALAMRRKKYFGEYFLSSTSSLVQISIFNILNFIKSTHWFPDIQKPT